MKLDNILIICCFKNILIFEYPIIKTNPTELYFDWIGLDFNLQLNYLDLYFENRNQLNYLDLYFDRTDLSKRAPLPNMDITTSMCMIWNYMKQPY